MWKKSAKKSLRELLGVRSTRKETLPLKPKSLTFHSWVIFQCKFSITLQASNRILYLDVLSLSAVVNNPKRRFTRNFKKKTEKEAFGNEFFAVSKGYCKIRVQPRIYFLCLSKEIIQDWSFNYGDMFADSSRKFKVKVCFNLLNGGQKGQAQFNRIYISCHSYTSYCKNLSCTCVLTFTNFIFRKNTLSAMHNRTYNRTENWGLQQIIGQNYVEKGKSSSENSKACYWVIHFLLSFKLIKSSSDFSLSINH